MVVLLCVLCVIRMEFLDDMNENLGGSLIDILMIGVIFFENVV